MKGKKREKRFLLRGRWPWLAVLPRSMIFFTTLSAIFVSVFKKMESWQLTVLLQIHSASIQILRMRLSTIGSRAFSVFDLSAWNVLPLPFRKKPSLDSFKSNLKTFLDPLWTLSNLI